MTPKFRIKDEVRIIGNTAGHNIKTGTVATITSISAQNAEPGFVQYKLKGFNYNVYGQDIEYLSREDRLISTLEEIKELSETLEKLKTRAENLGNYATDEEEEVALIKGMLSKKGQSQDAAIIAALKYFKG